MFLSPIQNFISDHGGFKKSLSAGESVEYEIVVGSDGKNKASKVTPKVVVVDDVKHEDVILIVKWVNHKYPIDQLCQCVAIN